MLNSMWLLSIATVIYGKKKLLKNSNKQQTKIIKTQFIDKSPFPLHAFVGVFFVFLLLRLALKRGKKLKKSLNKKKFRQSLQCKWVLGMPLENKSGVVC